MFTNNIQPIEYVFGSLEGLSLLDIGCGRGALCRALAKRGAKMTGADPTDTQLATARETVPDVDFVKAGAEALPFADDAFDGAIFLNALHHVPQALMAAALAEARRVVKPGGPVLVIEPLARGGYQEVFSPIDDETVIRQQALDAIAAFGAKETLRAEYDTAIREESLEAIFDHARSIDATRAAKIEQVKDEVAKRYDIYAKPHPKGGVTLDQPMIAIAF